jgi:hypothetical protein
MAWTAAGVGGGVGAGVGATVNVQRDRVGVACLVG